MSSPYRPDADPRRQVAAEIERRRFAIAAAEVDIGQAVLAQLHAPGAPAPSPAAQAELDGLAATERAVAVLGEQVRQVDAEREWELAHRPLPGSQCPVCRSSLVPGQRYCTVCGEKQEPLAANGAGSAVDETSAMHVLHAPVCRRCGRDVEHDRAYCARCGWRIALAPTRFYRTQWFRLLLAGFALYVFCQIMLPHTKDSPALIIATLVIGAGLVPAVFVCWFYERGTRDQTPLEVLVITFVCGAVLGCASAVLLESWFTIRGDWQYVPVGFIEEGCKIATVLIWLRRADLRRADKGLVIGAATGMGFAALETMQYGFNAFFVGLQQQVNPVHTMIAQLNARGLLAPLGHGTWTGILAAVIWFERAAGRSPFGPRVIGSYVAVSLLHALFDISISSDVGAFTVFGARIGIFGVLLGLVGFAALVLIVRAARRGQDPVAAFFERARSAMAPRPAYAGAPPPAYGPPPGHGPAPGYSPPSGPVPPPGYVPPGYGPAPGYGPPPDGLPGPGPYGDPR